MGSSPGLEVQAKWRSGANLTGKGIKGKPPRWRHSVAFSGKPAGPEAAALARTAATLTFGVTKASRKGCLFFIMAII